MSTCQGTKKDGEPCSATVDPVYGQLYCHWHDPAWPRCTDCRRLAVRPPRPYCETHRHGAIELDAGLVLVSADRVDAPYTSPELLVISLPVPALPPGPARALAELLTELGYVYGVDLR